MSQLTESVAKVIDEFAKLPGIGRKSAERLAYHILRVRREEALQLADAIRNVKENVRYCQNCFNLAEDKLCRICMDPGRDQTQLCIVEQPRDLMSLEQASVFRGLYHVLLGRNRSSGRDRARSANHRAACAASRRRRIPRDYHGDKSDR